MPARRLLVPYKTLGILTLNGTAEAAQRAHKRYTRAITGALQATDRWSERQRLGLNKAASDSMRLAIALLLSAATAYTPPRPPRRSPRSPGGNNKPPQRKREIIVEPLESWGAFDVGKHRMGVSTVSWGNPENGFVRKKKLRGGERFSQKDCRLAYTELMKSDIKTFAIPGGQAANDCFGKAVKKAKVFDPPKVVTYCAPSLKARYFGKEENRKRYGYASVATSVNDVLEVLGSAYVDACLVGGALPGSSCPSPPRARRGTPFQSSRHVQTVRPLVRGGLGLSVMSVMVRWPDGPNLALRS